MPPAFVVKKAFLTRRPRGSLTGWDDFPLVVPWISEGDNCTDITQSYNIKINDQVPGPQLNAPGIYKKINSFDQACFQTQWLIDKIQCASLYLFMVGTKLFLNYFMIILAPMVFHHLADSYYLETEVLLEDNNRKYKKVVLNKNYKTFDINNNIYLFLFYFLLIPNSKLL